MVSLFYSGMDGPSQTADTRSLFLSVGLTKRDVSNSWPHIRTVVSEKSIDLFDFSTVNFIVS